MSLLLLLLGAEAIELFMLILFCLVSFKFSIDYLHLHVVIPVVIIEHVI